MTFLRILRLRKYVHLTYFIIGVNVRNNYDMYRY